MFHVRRSELFLICAIQELSLLLLLLLYIAFQKQFRISINTTVFRKYIYMLHLEPMKHGTLKPKQAVLTVRFLFMIKHQVKNLP